MEADELAAELRAGLEHWCEDVQYRRIETETGNEDTGFFVLLETGERFLVTVAKVSE